MSDDAEERRERIRVRRQPPPFRRVGVRRVVRRSPRLVRVTLGGPELEGFTVEEPAASVRLLLPTPGSDELVLPEWNGNEWLLPGGRRPTIRTFTPRRAEGDELDVEIVVHGDGAASAWATAAGRGAAAAVSGPGRGYTVDPDAAAYLVAGDETAIAAMSQLLEALPGSVPATVHVEAAHPDARVPMPGHPRATVEWHDLPPGAPTGQTLVEAVKAAALPDGARVWAAGEAAAVQRIRRHLFGERGLPRSQASVRGYWKHGRTADPGAEG